jgi:hypothetical protein
MILLESVKITRLLNAVAVGTSSQNGSVLDMQGWDGVVFVASFGTITDGSPGLKGQQGSQADGSDAADLAGSLRSLATTDDNRCAVLDLFKPQKRYVRPVVVRGGATGSVIDGVIAIQYGGAVLAAVPDASALVKAVLSPAEGTP